METAVRHPLGAADGGRVPGGLPGAGAGQPSGGGPRQESAIREELDNASFVPSTEKPVQPQTGDMDDNVLGFLWSLQNDA